MPAYNHIYICVNKINQWGEPPYLVQFFVSTKPIPYPRVLDKLISVVDISCKLSVVSHMYVLF